MFHSTSKDNDYDYKKKQENLNVNKNRVTFDNIVPEKHPSQRVAELNEKEEAQLKPIQRHDEDEEPVEKKAAQLQEFRKLSGEEVQMKEDKKLQMKSLQRFAADEDINQEQVAAKIEDTEPGIIIIVKGSYWKSKISEAVESGNNERAYVLALLALETNISEIKDKYGADEAERIKASDWKGDCPAVSYKGSGASKNNYRIVFGEGKSDAVLYTVPSTKNIINEKNSKNRTIPTGKEPVYDGDAWFGSNFIGPGSEDNPYELPDPDNPGHFLQPKDMVDKAAQLHDYFYYKEGASGITGALFSKKVAYADLKLVADAFEIIKAYRNGGIDTVTGLPISYRTYNTALKVYIAFFPITVNKLKP